MGAVYLCCASSHPSAANGTVKAEMPLCWIPMLTDDAFGIGRVSSLQTTGGTSLASIKLRLLGNRGDMRGGSSVVVGAFHDVDGMASVAEGIRGRCLLAGKG